VNSANNPNSRKSVSKYNPIFSFKPTLFRQPSLTEESVDSISELIALGLLPTDSPINHIGSYGTEEDRSFDSMEARVAEASNDVLDDSRPSKKSNNALHNMPFSPIRLHSSPIRKMTTLSPPWRYLTATIEATTPFLITLTVAVIITITTIIILLLSVTLPISLRWEV
jgi:hypothetical protein